MKFLRRLLFSDVGSLIKIARTRIIEESDILPVPVDLDPRRIPVDESRVNWSSATSVMKSFVKTLRPYLVPAYVWYFASSLFSLASPILVNKFITLISDGVTEANLAITVTYGVLLGFCGFMTGLSLQHYFYGTLRSYQIITNIINKKIFSHSLRLSLQARQKNQIGDVVNHMSSDSDSIADMPLVYADMVNCVFMIVAVVGMLFYYMGVSTFAALAVLLSLAPLTKYIAKKFTHLDEEMMLHRDRRVTLMTQALNAIRVVKFFAWEKSVIKEVTDVREKELQSRRRLARAEVISGVAYLAVSTIVLFVALAVHAWRGEELTAALIFTCISLFGLLEGPFGDLSRLISRYATARVSATRIVNYLKQEEIPTQSEGIFSGPIRVRLQNVEAQYEGQEHLALHNINVDLPAGKSLAVVGPVGSGKSTILQVLLGEVPLRNGQMQFISEKGETGQPHRAYVPQEAYIINSSLLENMTFGVNANEGEIQKAIYASCLEKDIRELKGGLRTEIGEKGVNLSGGQKQRVSLARAYLANPELVLLDDPLSAVDIETEALLAERLIFGAWKNKTRVVVTHRLEFLSRFDQILYLEKGECKGIGSFAELLKTCPEFESFYAQHAETQGEQKETVTAEAGASAAATVAAPVQSEVRVTEDEDREVGAVKGSVYWDYISSLGGDNAKTRPWILVSLLVAALGVTTLPLAQKAWLSYYSSHSAEWIALMAVGIYGLLGLAVLLGSLLNHMFWLARGIKAGKNMHDKMLHSVLRSPVRFFDSTPVGRILQRFSRDVESVDVYLQWSFDSAIHCFLQVFVSLVLIVGVMPWMILVVAPVMFVYYVLQRDYRRPAREVKRFDSVARSPRYAHFKESLQGLSVIRGFQKSDWFMENFYDKLAHSQRMFASHILLNRWFSVRIPILGGLISAATALGVTAASYAGVMTPGTAGLVILYSLSFWGFLNWGVRVFADIESRMTSIERLKFFANLPGEIDIKTPATEDLRPTWPEFGEITVHDFKVRYAEHLPLVLKGLNFKIAAGSRVGLIGRTGSGKSTFFQSLFRFIEAEGGRIEIDGVNIASVPLERLRRNLAIIPQDPTLFMGTIRNNLDRYNEYREEEIIAALKQVFLWDYVNSLPLKLEAPIAEGGQNLSQGQRQLLCLARALLTKARVIVMDEATASVDVKTDALVQKVIRESLVGVTLLIIAHRLGTVADCDQIVELSFGEVKSIRTPSEISAEEIEESLV
ncbi:ABC transporter transmembrane domain-containing protein [Bdellovibrio sp. HCB2-146]|uniref:ABC transporter transmembrane domain-containing protein n=1 Tax=Bdellovibrio sp. HCB2-146 TaxID=3394362 RepID=UPI0039BC67E7